MWIDKKLPVSDQGNINCHIDFTCFQIFTGNIFNILLKASCKEGIYALTVAQISLGWYQTNHFFMHQRGIDPRLDKPWRAKQPQTIAAAATPNMKISYFKSQND